MMTSQTVKIVAEPQQDPQKCKFILETPITQSGSYWFHSMEEAEDSPLAYALLQVTGVVSVFIGGATITVTLSGEGDWREMGPKIGAAIRNALTSGKPLISEAVQKNIPAEDEIRVKVLEMLEKEINPAVASHGGYIELLDVRKNDIFIKMGGGCQGCAMSTATLKQGVETALRKEIPRLGSIYDTTDHAAGMNPYYSPAH